MEHVPWSMDGGSNIFINRCRTVRFMAFLCKAFVVAAAAILTVHSSCRQRQRVKWSTAMRVLCVRVCVRVCANNALPTAKHLQESAGRRVTSLLSPV